MLHNFLSEVAQSATNSANTGGDANFTAAADDSTLSDTEFFTFGLLDAKATATGAVAHFDTSPIPLGAVVDKTRIAINAASTGAGGSFDVDVLALTSRLDAVDWQYHDALVIYLPDTGRYLGDPGMWTSLWDLGRVSGGQTTAIRLTETQTDGLASISQAWTANSRESEIVNHWYVAAQSDLSSGARLRARVYSALGVAGSYRKGELLLDGDLIDPTGWSSTAAYHVMTPVESWSPTSGIVYITDLELIPGPSPSSTGHVRVHWNNTLDGSTDNVTLHAASDKKLQGFGGAEVAPQWQSPLAIKDASSIGGDTISSFPAWTEDLTYTMGSDDYAGDSNFVELPTFKSSIQTALDNRSSLDSWLGVRFQNFDAAATEIRAGHSIDSTTQTVLALGKSGPVLDIAYSLPFRTVALLGAGHSLTGLTGTGTSSVAMVGTSTSVAALTGSATSTHSTLSGSGVSRKGLNMTDDQDVTHIRGDDLQMPVTVTLDESRSLDGTEAWKWQLKRGVDSPSLISKTSPSGGITVDGSTDQPTIVITGSDFAASVFPPSTIDQLYLHELQMTKSAKVETVLRGSFVVRSDAVI
jgi:hypothetical protein